MLFTSNAWAQEAATTAAQQPGLLESFMPIVLIFIVFYFLLIRPQQKKVKAHQELVNNVKRGDNVVTGGGILGKVVEVDANQPIVSVEIAENVIIRINRSSIVEVLDKKAAKDEPSIKTAAKKAAPKKKTTK